MTEHEMLSMAREAGFEAALIAPEEVPVDGKYRAGCEENRCGRYNANYACPPDCGAVEEMAARIRGGELALVLTSSWPIESYGDTEAIRHGTEEHNRASLRLLDALRERKRLQQNLQQQLASRLEVNRRMLSAAQAQTEDLKRCEERRTWLEALADTANGRLNGKDRVMLETYVQMTCFDRVLRHANTRLMVMTGGQYELLRRKEASSRQSYSGLELDVLDHYNGTTRAVGSLSGGDSFKASLALALGMSDAIQASAGGVQLDTMFVDEGFGSLDEESLEMALQALSSLSQGHRLVGLISHVNTLKERIDRRIVVTKAPSGGSHAAIAAQ